MNVGKYVWKRNPCTLLEGEWGGRAIIEKLRDAQKKSVTYRTAMWFKDSTFQYISRGTMKDQSRIDSCTSVY